MKPKNPFYLGQTVVTPDGHDCQVITENKKAKWVDVRMPDGTVQKWPARSLKRTIETL